jgi:hypothetical protein
LWHLDHQEIYSLIPNNRKYYDNGYEADIIKLPGWKEADETVKQKLLR